MSSSLKTLHVLCLEAGRVLSTGDVLNDAIAIDNASRCNQEVAPWWQARSVFLSDLFFHPSLACILSGHPT